MQKLIFTTTGTGLTINFDDAKTGTYSLLVDNFHDYGIGSNGTGTVYIDSANVIPQPQEYNIDWNKVLTNSVKSPIYWTYFWFSKKHYYECIFAKIAGVVLRVVGIRLLL